MNRSLGGTWNLGSRIRIFPSKILLLGAAIFFLVYLLLNNSAQSDKELYSSRKEILELSKKYVKELSHRLQLVDDGPAAFPDTAYDMKKALAVLIDDLNTRVESLNDRVLALEGHALKDDLRLRPIASLASRKTRKDEEALGAIDLLESKQDVCPYPDFDEWPQCKRKILWMQEMWESDPCYAEWGVDGSDCSILIYLSEQERWCPPFEWRNNKTQYEDMNSPHETAMIREDFSSLYDRMGDSMFFKWIKTRIERMSPKWIDAGKIIGSKYKSLPRRKKRILFHMGLLSEENGWDIAKNAFSGGPLGELVQWSDIISAVYILGHDITLTKSVSDLKSIYDPYLKSASSNCPLKARPFDVVYSDITGLKMLRKVSGSKFHLLQCNVRVLDSFGTEPEFNHPTYAGKKSHKTAWGKWNLNPKQFNTMFPHSPDNTFLGFVVEEHINDTTLRDIKKENIALVYGKRDVFWEGKESYIAAIQEVVQVHSTVDKNVELKHVPSFVHNHGILSGSEIHELLRKVKVFVGLGFPYEGPAPLEAIANGAVFLNPVFSEPKNSENTPFFKGKPTLRRLTSQHPYAEMYVGAPHVRSVNMDDLDSVKAILHDVINDQNIPPHLPYEFTCEGMLERLSFYLEKQDFCTGSIAPVWPPMAALQVKVTDDKQTCSDVCHADGLICEPSYFPILNRQTQLAKLNITCAEVVLNPPSTEVDYPAFLGDKCFMQSDIMLFSCAGRYTGMRRVCPCRDYLQGQIALCKSCVEV